VRYGKRLGCQPEILDLEEMEFDLEPGNVVEAGLHEFRQCVAIERSGRDRNLLAVREIAVAQQPAGILRPRQQAKRFRVGDHDEIAGAAHLGEPHAGARLEHRKDVAMRRVLGEQRARHRDAAAQCARCLRGHQRLSAQHAMLVGERETHEFQLVAADRLVHRRSRAHLRIAPETVLLDEALVEQALGR
jgi:hypothetical protein